MNEHSEKELFETMPVHKAVASLAVPTVISQIVSIIYNLADTFFIGQLGNPYMVAAATLVYPWFTLLTALGNLFGIGGSSLASRLLGAKRSNDVKYVSSFCFYGGIVSALLFSVLSFFMREPLLNFLGASEENFVYAEAYLLWVVVLGGIPTVISMIMAHFLRSEVYAKQASTGMMLGGILNIIIDPVFIYGFNMGFSGAAVATALSNLVSMIFFMICFQKLKGRTSLSLSHRCFRISCAGQVFSVGISSALTSGLATMSNMTIIKLASDYGDIAVAAYGIVKKIDMFPLGISMGLCQGFMPLVGYNYASKNYQRMKDVSVFSWKTALVIALCFMTCFLGFAPWLTNAFIRDEQTGSLGAEFLRIACLAVPLQSVNALIIYTLQAMGKGLQSAVLTLCRQGLLNIPLLVIMNRIFGLYGMIWTQLTIETIMLPAAVGMYIATLKKLKKDELSKEITIQKEKIS